jgi:hypothetical protein
MAITLDGTNGITTPALENDGVTTVAAGSASAPAITTDGDTNTGIFFPAADTIAFAEGGAEAMRINSSGNVGIGTTSPAAVANYKVMQITGNSTSNGGLIRLETSDGTSGVARFYAGSGSTVLESNSNTPLTFGTNATEHMRILSGGAVCVGQTTAGGGSDVPGIYVKSTSAGNQCYTAWNSAASGTRYFAWFGVDSPFFNVGAITSNGSSTAYVTSSDYRLKENIAPMTGALATVAQLKPCTYKWKVNGTDGQGFIAHELQAVVPECVTGEKDAVETYVDEEGVEQTRPVYQGIDTSFLVATLTAAIQELSAKNDALEARIAALEGAQA